MQKFVLLFTLLSSFACYALPTRIVVYVKSKDAKFIGTSLGGAAVRLLDAKTQEVLAEGKTEGATGNTTVIMKEPCERGKVITDAQTAKFSAVLDLTRPTQILVEAYGPLLKPHAANRVTSTQWVFPGKHIDQGNAFLLEMAGLIVDLDDTLRGAQRVGLPQKVPVQARVSMLCGCPIGPGGVWDSKKFEVKAVVTRNGEFFKEMDLLYTGNTSEFGSSLEVSESGQYEVTVYAYDEKNGNTGVDTTTFTIE